MLCIYTHVYVYICICALLVITTMALSQLMYLGTTVDHVPKCMRCHKTIVAMTGRIHCFHDYIYITPILLWRDLSTLCVRAKRLETTLHKQKSYVMLLLRLQTTMYRKTSCSMLSINSLNNNAQVKTLSNVAREAPNNTA